MQMLGYAIQEDFGDEYVYDTLYGSHNNGNVVESKTFSIDAENQQWLEGGTSKLDVEKEIAKMHHEGDMRLFIPRYWTVEAMSTGVIAATLQLCMAEVGQGKVQSIQEKEWQIECDLPHGEVQAWPIGLLKPRRGGWVGAFSCSRKVVFPDLLGSYYVEIPTVVTEVVMSYMQNMAEEEFGFRPTYMGNIHGLEHMIAFCMRPLDLNIHRLCDLIGRDYENIFPREQRDNYRPLCEFFQLTQPPKSLRKAYAEASENFVAYLLLRQLGFRDINVIRRFFHRDKLFSYRLLDLRYNTEEAKLTFPVYNESARYLRWLEKFCHGFLRHRKETQLANCLHPLAVQDEWLQNDIDILRMFAASGADRNDTALHPDTMRTLLKEGFTQNVHDLLMDELPGIIHRRPQGGYDLGALLPPEKNMEFQYTDKELDYADKVKGYHIVLPKDTNELRRYGKIFHNCVASYVSSVLEKLTIILVLRKGEKYIACLEVKQNRLVQAKGPCNQGLARDIDEILCLWAESKKIAYRKRYQF